MYTAGSLQCPTCDLTVPFCLKCQDNSVENVYLRLLGVKRTTQNDFYYVYGEL